MMIMGAPVQVPEEMALKKMASFSKVQDDLLPKNLSICFPIPDGLSNDGREHAAPALTPRHCRSLSAPAEASSAPVSGDLSPSAFQQVKENWSGWKWKMMKKNNGDKKRRALYDRRVALEEDVANLQTQLKTERAVRVGLERALGQNKEESGAWPCEVPSSTFSPKAKELITEIASLETEVASLEQHVLSLYRKVLDTQICPSTPNPAGQAADGRMSLTSPSTPTPAPEAAESAAPSPGAPPQPRLFSRISLKRKSNALSASQHRRQGSTPGTPTNEPEDKIVTTLPSATLQPKSRHVSLLGGAFNCIDGSSADEIPTTSQQLSIPPLVQESPSLPEAPKVDLQSRSSSRQSCRDSTDRLSQELVDVTLRSAPLPLLTYGSQSAPVSRPSSERGSGSGKLYPESPRIYPGSPNRLSEELVRCMAAIYCKLADPPLSQSSVPISPASSSSSSASSTTTTSSPRGSSSECWSPKWVRGGGDRSSEVLSLVDPFQLKDRKGDVVGAYHSAVEVPWICVDKDRLNYAARALRNFRSMVEQLEQVDPGLMKHDEKMAFWINIYNALMMHAYLAYGIPRSHLKRVALLQKASYKIGPHSINAHNIEHCILGCRARRPTQWLQTLFTTGPRFKAGDERKAYALDKPEPIVCFGLCCGGRSDPAIRVYTAKHIRHELEIAKREYLQASVGVRSGSRVLLPRILEWFSREQAVTPASLLDWVSQHVGDHQQIAIRKLLQSRSHKSAAQSVEWLQYNSGFRYIFVRDLARVAPSVSQ